MKPNPSKDTMNNELPLVAEDNGRGANGRFLEGNPGKQHGTKTRAGKLREKILLGLEDVVDRLQEQALQGDVAAAKLLLDRGLPVLRPESAPIVLNIEPNASLADIAKVVVNEMFSGNLPPNVAAELASAIMNIQTLKTTIENHLPLLDINALLSGELRTKA